MEHEIEEMKKQKGGKEMEEELRLKEEEAEELRR